MSVNRDSINVIGAEVSADRLDLYYPYGVLIIDWKAESIGFGRLALSFDENGRAHIHSEHMDSSNDKRFTKAVLMKIIEDAIVEE